LAAALKQEPGVEVEVVNGNRGELKILVDGGVVAKKFLFFKPSVEKVVSAVREVSSAAASPATDKS
jgi:hypothetical protein